MFWRQLMLTLASISSTTVSLVRWCKEGQLYVTCSRQLCLTQDQILVTHHIELCSSIARQVIRIEAGKILSQTTQTPSQSKATTESNDTVLRPDHLATGEKLVKDEEVKEGTVSFVTPHIGRAAC